MKLSHITGLAAGLALMAFGAAQAQEGAGAHEGHGNGRVREACAADIAKFCPDVHAGGGRVMECFKSHREDLSEGCKSALMERRAEHRAAKADAAAAPAPQPQ
jgi:hypothetical protein